MIRNIMFNALVEAYRYILESNISTQGHKPTDVMLVLKDFGDSYPTGCSDVMRLYQHIGASSISTQVEVDEYRKIFLWLHWWACKLNFI